MKIYIPTHPLFFFMVFFISLSVTSQNACSTYYPFKEGIKFQITNFDKKGKKESVANHEIISINNNVATISTTVSDKKNKEITSSTFDVTCSEEGISIDFKSLMNPEMFKQYEDMEIDMTGTNIIFPNKLNVGERLPDASLIMAINMGGMKMNMNIDMINRNVNAQESITTAAGTFNCFALSYDSEIKMGIKQTFTVKEWIAEGVGAVKTETYNKGGKLMAYSELTNITNN